MTSRAIFPLELPGLIATTVLPGDRLRPPSLARIVKKRGSFSGHVSDHSRPCGGFTLIEFMIVTVFVGLLAGLTLPEFDAVRQRAYNAAALADLNNANKEIERTTFSIRDASNPATTRVHMHINHEASRQYYHYEYPKGGVPDLRWK